MWNIQTNIMNMLLQNAHDNTHRGESFQSSKCHRSENQQEIPYQVSATFTLACWHNSPAPKGQSIKTFMKTCLNISELQIIGTNLYVKILKSDIFQ